MSSPQHCDHLVIGGGPAGLTAAFELVRRGHRPWVIEASAYLGGIARTHVWEGNRIDIGGHRFFTKSAEVERLWAEMLDEPMLKVRRLSRIFYQGRFYDYPLQIGNTLQNLGAVESLQMLASYLKARWQPTDPVNSFEDWVRNHFGDRLYRTFFKTYTEKVWGIPCSEIRADWAAQRIQGLSFLTAVLNALRNSGKVKSLIKTFDYPRLGPGMLWESAAAKITAGGGTVLTGAEVLRLHHDGSRVTSVEASHGGIPLVLTPREVVSTMPLSHLVQRAHPAPAAEVRQAAAGLRYRDFLIVALECRVADLFPDNWIYVHAPEVRVGRIQNFRNWSPALVAPGNGTTLGMEYFCSRGDDLWSRSDADLVELAKNEIHALGLASRGDLGRGHVIRELNAYPVYDSEYMQHLGILRPWVASLQNLQTAGRNGLHRYNNQDHSMLAGHHAALRLLGRRDLDPWDVNTERSYYEEVILAHDKQHAATDILVADLAPPHETSAEDLEAAGGSSKPPST